MDLELRGKTVLVTGGSKGVGAGICRVFAEEGANVVVNYRSDANHAQSFAAELAGEFKTEVIALQADVSAEAEAVGLFARSVEHFSGVDIVVNNAATWTKHLPVEEFSVEEYRRASNVNVESALLMSRELVKLKKAQGKPAAHILNVLTKSVFWSSSINNSTYVATKGALAALTRNLAHELGKDGIFVNAVIPGYVWNSSMDASSERYKRTLAYIPDRKMATPVEIGAVCAFLCSKKASQINGAMVDCSGGTMNGHGSAAIKEADGE